MSCNVTLSTNQMNFESDHEIILKLKVVDENNGYDSYKYLVTRN